MGFGCEVPEGAGVCRGACVGGVTVSVSFPPHVFVFLLFVSQSLEEHGTLPDYSDLNIAHQLVID
jgi:hypothetical protein